jgi:hypothetical protein
LGQIIIVLHAIQIIKGLQQGLPLKEVYLESIDYADDVNSIVQRCRPLKSYLKSLAEGMKLK